MKFIDLLNSQDHRLASRQFPLVVKASQLQMWNESWRPQTGTRIVLGIAVYHGRELQLLDQINEKLSQIQYNSKANIQVEVWDTIDYQGFEDFEKYIPGIGQVMQTPALGIWCDGLLVERATGARARALAETTVQAALTLA